MGLTAGYTGNGTSCASKTGGTVKVKIGNINDLASITFTSGKVSAYTLDVGATVYEFTFDIEQSLFNEAMTGDYSGYWNRDLQLTWQGRNADLRDRIMELNDDACGYFAVIEEGNGNKIIVGVEGMNQTPAVAYAPMKLLTNTGSTNTGGQTNGISTESITLRSTWKNKAFNFTGTV